MYGGVSPDCSRVNDAGGGELGCTVLTIVPVVLTTFGGRTKVELGVMIVVMYARITSTVGAFVTVTRYPLWKGSRIVLTGTKSL